MTDMPHVAFIGAGQMGGRLARRVMAAGHPLTVCDLSPAVRESFEADGAAIAERPADCAAADIVAIFVMSGPQAIEAVAGPGGLAEGVDPARPPIVLVMSTILPSEVHRIAEALAPTGARVVDCAVTGGLTRASDGLLTLLAGGAEADIDEVEPLLRVMGRTILRCGPLGSGETAKIINNMVGTVNLYVAYESYRLGQAYGMSPGDVARLLEQGTGWTYWHKDPSDALAHYDLLSRNPDYFSTVLHASAKDWKLAIDLGEEAGLRLPFLDAMIHRVVEADDGRLHADWRAFVATQAVTEVAA